MLNLGFALVSVVHAAAAFAQATPPPDMAAIPPVVWELTEFGAQGGAPVDVTEPQRYTVQFLPEGDLAIGAVCNSAGASYTAQDGTLEISPIRSTLILCPPDSQGQPFLNLLEAATTYELDSDGLLVLTGPEGTLRMRPALTAVVWVWQEFAGSDDSVIAPEHPEHYTLTFLPEGKLAIQADCNRAMGTFAIAGAVLDLTVGGATRATCPPGSLMARYLSDLEDVSSHVFRDGNLYLALPVDAGIMEFVARAVEPTTATPVAG